MPNSHKQNKLKLLREYPAALKPVVESHTPCLMSENNTKTVPFLNNQKESDDQDDTLNGLCFVDKYIPEEILLHILSYIHPLVILKYSLVCRKWNKLIKSYSLWAAIYRRKYNKKPKNLPWYLYYCLFSTNYFDTNLLRNGNGQNHFKYWQIEQNGGDEWIVEDLPAGSDPLPEGVPEFNKKTSCFATSCGTCSKNQKIQLGQSKLFKHILDCYKPHIYLSEWTSGRSYCGCIYKLGCEFLGEDLSDEYYAKPCVEHRVKEGESSKWKKIEIIIMEYPQGVESITFEHEGCDTQGYKGHYGSKMAGGVVKLLFDSIEKLPIDEDGKEIPKKFDQFDCVSNAAVVQEYSRYFYLKFVKFHCCQPSCDTHDEVCGNSSDDVTLEKLEES